MFLVDPGLGQLGVDVLDGLEVALASEQLVLLDDHLMDLLVAVVVATVLVVLHSNDLIITHLPAAIANYLQLPPATNTQPPLIRNWTQIDQPYDGQIACLCLHLKIISACFIKQI